eukprot:TRINITY_DN776042_c0_g1_i1.p1 TRINITY_DN776042_c0_g1~~TRINITY_DN776042_c0_g1_i1.p1  ORF type:complete len:400 (-),score=103.06 TRINITY_DN776042_c0_g1_i1:196-1395(-)
MNGIFIDGDDELYFSDEDELVNDQDQCPYCHKNVNDLDKHLKKSAVCGTAGLRDFYEKNNPSALRKDFEPIHLDTRNQKTNGESISERHSRMSHHIVDLCVNLNKEEAAKRTKERAEKKKEEERRQLSLKAIDLESSVKALKERSEEITNELNKRNQEVDDLKDRIASTTAALKAQAAHDRGEKKKNEMEVKLKEQKELLRSGEQGLRKQKELANKLRTGHETALINLKRLQTVDNMSAEEIEILRQRRQRLTEEIQMRRELLMKHDASAKACIDDIRANPSVMEEILMCVRCPVCAELFNMREEKIEFVDESDQSEKETTIWVINDKITSMACGHILHDKCLQKLDMVQVRRKKPNGKFGNVEAYVCPRLKFRSEEDEKCKPTELDRINRDIRINEGF